MFYVYSLIDPSTDEIFYIGKGKNNRMLNHLQPSCKENIYMKRKLNKLKKINLLPKIKKIEENLKEGDAFLLEHTLIKTYGRKGIEKNGILLNRSLGFEHFNIKNINDNEEIESIVKELNNNTKNHFNFKPINPVIEKLICELYNNNFSLFQIRDKIGKIGVGKIKNILISNNIKIRNKSETRIGEKNPAFGRRGLITKGFSGRKHSEHSKIQIGKSQIGKTKKRKIYDF